MTPEEFHRQEHSNVDNVLFSKSKDLGLIKDIDYKFAERYHQAKLKLLGIVDVVEKNEHLVCRCGFEKKGNTVPCIRNDCDNIFIDAK